MNPNVKIKTISSIILEFSKIFLPQTGFYLSIFLQQTVIIAFTSRTYKNNLMINAIGVINIYLNCTLIVILTGIVCALDTLASNAYGAKNYKLMGSYLSRARWIALVFFLIMNVCNAFLCERILTFFKVDETILPMAKEYFWLYSFTILINIPFSVTIRYMALIEKTYVLLSISICTFILHILWSYLLISFFELGLKGAGLSLLLTQILNTASTEIYCHFSNQPEGSLQYFTKESFCSWGDYFKIAAPGIVIKFGDWIGFELQGLFALYFSPVDYSVHVILTNLELFILSTAIFGINIVIAMKTGEKIVSEEVSECKYYIRVTYCLTYLISLGIVLVLLIFGNYYLRIMSPSEEVYAKSKIAFNVFYLYTIAGSGMFFFLGVLRGLGFLLFPMIVACVCGFIVESGLSYFFAFYLKLGVTGVWLSLYLGIGCIFIMYAFLYFSLDLNESQKAILERLEKDNEVFIETYDTDDQTNKEIKVDRSASHTDNQ